MYKLLIVDDEVLVRDAIKHQMNWEEHGFRCVGDCEDGVEALEFVTRDMPDVVLTDIGMPFMDGLELTRRLADQYPEVRVIILTGYDDFDYAQQAIKLQAVDYILKPVTAAELGNVLRKLEGELDLARRQKQDYEHLKQQLTENMPLLRDRFLERMMTSRLSKRQRLEGWDYYGLRWEGPYLIELAIDVDEFVWSDSASTTDQQLIRFAVCNVAQEIMGKLAGSAVFRDREDRVLALLSGSDPDALEEEALQAAERIHEAVTAILPVKASIGIGQRAEWDGDIPFAHQSALSALDYRFVIGSNTIIRLSDMAQRNRPEALAVVAWENELITKLKTGTPEELERWVDHLFAAIREQLLPAELCQMYLQRIVLTLMHTLYETNGSSPVSSPGMASPLHEIAKFVKLDEAREWMKRLCAESVRAIRGRREDYSVQQVAKAIEYVKFHYKNPELSLKDVCQHISMSASYFSALFKHNTGKTFVEFVTDERMEKAKELLALTSMKSYEVAYEVGYGDPHYFSGAFKKHTGDTPTEYRLKTMKEA
ncbi:response regulator [Paenibacillus sp. LHD-117]|uniref:response regulator n=1 Tax=Paenibacillus sp. LHD-117 TaxID=3071412 RepID=UPI0027E0280F|nr:response regulator [Paenibacillus sp. LHD-117]MDQ6422448.1 response regulator [Paenibacillus sp. LHD-117]